MAKESTFQLALKGFGIPAEGVVWVCVFLSVVIHTERLFDIAAVDLDDPPALFRELDGFGVGPVEVRQKGRLLNHQDLKPELQITKKRSIQTLPHGEVLRQVRRGGISWGLTCKFASDSNL